MRMAICPIVGRQKDLNHQPAASMSYPKEVETDPLMINPAVLGKRGCGCAAPRFREAVLGCESVAEPGQNPG